MRSTNFAGPLGSGLLNSQKPYNYRVNNDWSLSPTFLMHTMFSYSKTRQTWDNPNQKGFGSQFGFNLTGDSDATPRIQFNGPAGLAGPSNPAQLAWGVADGKVANGAQFNKQWQISQGYTLLRGKHEFKFGGAWRHFQTLGLDLAGTNGTYVFNRAQTGLLGQASTGHEFASFLLGAVDQASNVVPPVLFDTSKYYDNSVYFHDNWK